MLHVSVFVGKVRALPDSGRPTGMYKQRVCEALQLHAEGFAGDRQADLRVHGGPEKAVHLYPARHYARLAAAFPDAAPRLVPGSLGENLSCDELDEHCVRVGQVWRLGQAELQVCQPRNPCWKIDERHGCPGMAAFIAEQRITGWYWRVLRPGLVRPDDALEPMDDRADATTLGDALRLWQERRPPLDELARLATTPGIAARWRSRIEQRIAWLRANPDAPRDEAAGVTSAAPRR